MADIKLIAFDLDGTLVTTDKRITQRTLDTLRKASEAGIAIVPATGRFLQTIPEALKNSDLINYIISINGAYVYDTLRKEPVYTAEMPISQAMSIFSFLDGFDAAYDCYQDNQSFVPRHSFENIDHYIEDVFYLNMFRNSRKITDDFRMHVSGIGKGVQKIMAYTTDEELKKYLMKELAVRFTDLIITSSIRENIEINNIGANKGIALCRIAENMGISMDKVMAFGDSHNDIPMLRAAGLGVCMSNGVEEAKKNSDIIAPSNDEDGVAYIIEKEVYGI